MADFNQELDTRGLHCPLSILHAKKTMDDMASGETLKIVTTDPGSVENMQAYAVQTGNEFISSSEDEGEFTFYIKKSDVNKALGSA